MSPSALLRSDATPGQGALAPSKASAPRDEQARQTSPSFDEVLLSSLTTGLETTGKVAVKTPASTPAREAASDVKDAPTELANVIAMTLLALDGSGIKTAAAGQRPGRRADQPADLSDASQAAALEALAPDSAVVASGTRRPGVRLASAVTASAAAVKAEAPSSSPGNLLSTDATATGAVPAPATGSSKADRYTHGDATGNHSRYPTVAMNADSTAALANSMPLLARPAGADLTAPDRAAADGTKHGPGLRVEPATTTSMATTAAGTITARPALAGLDRGVPVTAEAPSTALQPGLASPAGQPLAGQTTLPAQLAAASDNPALLLATESSAARLSAAASDKADRWSRDQATGASSLLSGVALAADSTTVATGSLLPADARARPERRLPQSPTQTGPSVTASETGSSAARTPRQAMTVKAALLNASTDNSQPGLANTPATALKSAQRPLPGSSDEARQSVLPAEPAGSNQPPAAALAAGTLANPAPGFDSGTPGADALGASAPSLLHTLQPAAAGATGHAAANSTGNLPSAPRLSPEVGSKEWNQALGQQVLQMGKAGQQVTELQLNPPGLGPMQITLHLNQHQMQVMFVSAHASVRAAVEAAVPQLRASLADNGISLGQTSVSSESQAQSAFARNQNAASRQQAYRNNSLPEAAAVSARTLTTALRRGAGLGVDTYA